MAKPHFLESLRRRARLNDVSPGSRALTASAWHGTLCCVLALFLFPATAHAYLDPGTGSLLFQSFLALVFGVGASWRRLREWTRRRLGRSSRRESHGERD